MTLEQVGALSVISVFAVFIVWGKSPGGRAALTRAFGSPRKAPSAGKGAAPAAKRARRPAAPAASRARPGQKAGRNGKRRD